MGTMSFEEPGIAPLGPTCTSPDLEPNAEPAPGFEAFSEAFILDTQVVGYAGPLRIKGTGQLGCQTASSGAGALQLEAHGDNQLNGSSIDCPDLDGNFIRVGTHMSVHLTGPCTINEEETTPIQFLGEFEFVPTDADQGAGVTQPIMSAEIAGAFSMTPS